MPLPALVAKDVDVPEEPRPVVVPRRGVGPVRPVRLFDGVIAGVVPDEAHTDQAPVLGECADSIVQVVLRFHEERLSIAARIAMGRLEVLLDGGPVVWP